MKIIVTAVSNGDKMHEENGHENEIKREKMTRKGKKSLKRRETEENVCARVFVHETDCLVHRNVCCAILIVVQ